jgi:membrane fusion protein, multidrug efflux system
MTDTNINSTTPANGSRNRNLLVITGVFAVLGIAWLIYWSQVLRWRERTDDAYVNGDVIQVTSRVAGTVTSFQRKDMDAVEAGQTLLTLDNSDAQVQLEKAASALASAVRQYRQQSEQAAQLDAAITTQKLELERAREDLARREPLIKEQAIAAEELAHAKTAVSVAEAALIQTQRQAQSLHALLDGTTVRSHPAVQQAKATYIDAWLNAGRNTIVAPVSGHITQHNVQLGQRIQPGQTLMAIVPLGNVWVDANFKEVQLRNLRMGQAVTLVSDLYGNDVTYHGTVAGIGIGTGAAFSLLPAQNASGNWIKVIQRVPVRIDLDEKEVADHPLRIGLSTTVTVDTHDRSGPVLANAKSKPASGKTGVYATDMKAVEAEAERIIAAQLK